MHLCCHHTTDHMLPRLRAFQTLRAPYTSVPDDMSGNITAKAPGHLKLENSLAPVHVSKGRKNPQLSSVGVLSASSRSAHRHIPRSHSGTASRRGTCHCRAADTHQVSARRRGRRYQDKLLDNLEADQPADRQKGVRNPRADPRRQVDKQASDTSSRSSSQTSSTSGDKAEEGIGWGEGGVPDDWGWGLENPTLAAATGSYESELKAQQAAHGKQTREGWLGPEGESDLQDNWDVQEPQQDVDWDDEAHEDFAQDNSAVVTLLDSREVDQLLKIAPQQQQVQYYSGTPVDLGVRIGTGLLVTLVVNKLPLLAAGSLCFPLWWPIYKAWWHNQKLRSQYRYVGLWQTNVLALNLVAPPRLRQEPAKPTINFLFGDDSSARTQVDVPYNQRYEEVHVGEPAELLLLSNTPDFSSFKALKEVYLPESGVWIAKYPFMDRDVFLDISLDIERERKTQQAAQWPT